MPVVVNEDSSRPFLPSSPTDGLESESEGWVAQDPGSEYFGDSKFGPEFRHGWLII